MQPQNIVCSICNAPNFFSTYIRSNSFLLSKMLLSLDWYEIRTPVFLEAKWVVFVFLDGQMSCIYWFFNILLFYAYKITCYVTILDFDIGNHTTIRYDHIVVLKMGFYDTLLIEIYDCQDSLALICFLYLLRVNWKREREK